MTRTATLFILLCPFLCVSRAQTTVGGRAAFYDTLTETYLVSVPEGYEPDSVPDGVNVGYTHLPVLGLDGVFGNNYSEGTLTLSLPSGTLSSYPVKAKYRGGSTNASDRHKHNFHVKLLDSKGNSADKSLLGMRSDDSWLLDAGQIDLGRIRNHVAQEIWRDMGNAPYYADTKPEARNYVGSEFVELFVNDTYFGLYSLSEAVDRKQMQLEKYDGYSGEIRGELYKASSWTYTTMYGPFSPPDDESGAWGGFELKYPEIEDVCPTDWGPFYEAVTFADGSGKAEFAAGAGEYFDIPVLADYFVFHNILAATDHGGKNVFWACYDIRDGGKFTPAIWDYDTTLGQHWNNSYVHSSAYGPETGDFLTQAAPKIIYRLVTEDTGGFVDMVLQRYRELRETVFSEDSLTSRYNGCFDTLRASGTLRREEARWSGDSDINGLALDFDDEQAYIDDYIRRRLEYLDGIFTPEAAEEAIAAAVKEIAAPGAGTGKEPAYNTAGQRVDGTYRGIVITGGKKILVR